MDVVRRALRISRPERNSNEEVRRKADIKGTLFQDIERSQLIWYDHFQRMDDERMSKTARQWVPLYRQMLGKLRNPEKKRYIKSHDYTRSPGRNEEGSVEWMLGIGQRRKML